MRTDEGVKFVELDALLQEVNDEDEIFSPEQQDVGDVADGLGITYRATEELRVGVKDRERDAHRWELNPACAEDYLSRTHARN